ncbi:MAG TPA: hypothetical protein VG275_06935 [Solirubrobacteraceae bacterium]|nr:hypothetical protein [Solirubrobacteraceae bacterium]
MDDASKKRPEPGDVIGGRFEVRRLVAIGALGKLDERCISNQCGGSHYHCPSCGAVVSMCGHDEAGCERERAAGRDLPAWVDDDEDELANYDPCAELGGAPCERCGQPQDPWRFSRLCQACIWDEWPQSPKTSP